MSLPQRLKHLAIIMDGNGRWAERHQRRRIFGHVRGARTARSIIQYCSQLKLPVLSLFALSAENILRPKNEVKALTNLLEKVFVQHSHLLIQEQIKLNILGDLTVFSSKLKNLCKKLCEKTQNHQGLNLIVALNYSGRQEIVQAFKKVVKKIEKGSLQTKNINEKTLSSFFCSSFSPPPDLIIRSGGQMRLSNFYLWSSAYSELYFTETLWPDFNKKSMDQALQQFTHRQRRFGRL